MKSVRTSRYSLSIVIGKYWKYLSTRWKKHATCATSKVVNCPTEKHGQGTGSAWNLQVSRTWWLRRFPGHLMDMAMDAMAAMGHTVWSPVGNAMRRISRFGPVYIDNLESLGLQQSSFNFTRYVPSILAHIEGSQGAKFRRCVIKLVMLDLGSHHGIHVPFPRLLDDLRIPFNWTIQKQQKTYKIYVSNGKKMMF